MFIYYSQGELQLLCEILVTNTLFKPKTGFVIEKYIFQYSSKDWDFKIFNFK